MKFIDINCGTPNPLKVVIRDGKVNPRDGKTLKNVKKKSDKGSQWLIEE